MVAVKLVIQQKFIWCISPTLRQGIFVVYREDQKLQEPFFEHIGIMKEASKVKYNWKVHFKFMRE